MTVKLATARLAWDGHSTHMKKVTVRTGLKGCGKVIYSAKFECDIPRWERERVFLDMHKAVRESGYILTN